MKEEEINKISDQYLEIRKKKEAAHEAVLTKFLEGRPRPPKKERVFTLEEMVELVYSAQDVKSQKDLPLEALSPEEEKDFQEYTQEMEKNILSSCLSGIKKANYFIKRHPDFFLIKQEEVKEAFSKIVYSLEGNREVLPPKEVNNASKND